jgi:Domain of unknown function (DUF4440)
MLKTIVGLLATLLFLTPLQAQTASVDSVKVELRALMTELNAALAAKDRTALERIYADDFLFVHALGTAEDKKRQIDTAMASRGGAGIPVPAFDGLIVFGDVAIYRRPEPERFGTTIYVKRAGRWQLFQMQGTPLPSTRTNAAVPADVLRSYAGRYAQDNGLFVIIAVEGSGLTLQVEGRQKFTLTTDSQNTFSLPAGGGQFTFGKNAEGVMAYELVRGNGTVVKGVRQP